MNKIIFNDGRTTEIQEAKEGDGILRVRMILKTQEELKVLFGDPFATLKMTIRMEGRETEYENYNNLAYIKEEAGGIWEVELFREEADLKTKVKNLETLSIENEQKFEMAVAEMTIAMAAIQGGNENV